MSKLWQNIFNKNIYAPAATARLQGAPITDSFPFLVELRHVGVKADTTPGIRYQLRACLYDAQYHRFYGRAWRGQWTEAAPAVGQLQKILFSEAVYFHIPYKDNSNLLVVELVRQRQAPFEETMTLGWAVLRLTPSVARNDIPHAVLEMFQGSPQILTLLSEPVESDVKLRKSGISLHYGLRSHALLRKVFDFIPINTIIGAEEPVPGVESSEENMPILSNPVPKLQSPAVLEHVTVQLGPLAHRIENEVRDYLNKERLLKDNKVFDGEVMEILERRIRICVHNGWSNLHEPKIFHLSSSDTAPDTRSLHRKTTGKGHTRSSSWQDLISGSGADKALYLSNRIDLTELIQDPGIALVFYYQLLVVLQSTKPNPPAKVVTLAWGVWSPFGDGTPVNRPVSVSLPLRGGPTRNPDGILCFTDFYSLPELVGQRGDRITRSGKTNAITVEFQYNAHPKKLEDEIITQPAAESAEMIQPHPSKRPSITSPHGGPSPVPSSRQPTPAPPPRAGRAPLPSAIKKTADQPAQILPYPFYGPRVGLLGSHALVPSLGAYPYPAPAGQMTELTISGPIHAPILALQQQHWRAGGIPRSTLSILDQTKFQSIVDRHGELPELVDVFDSGAFSLDGDLKDPLICNEIVFQFMAFARPNFRSHLPGFAFFTFNFYRFPQVTTERLLLATPESGVSDSKSFLKILRRVDSTGQMIVGSPGFIVKFIVDPEYLKPGEREHFLEYLYSQQLSIDVWDGESLMLIGSCLLPLRQLCRRNQEAVQAYCQLPVVTTELESHFGDGNIADSSEDYGIRPVMRGLLYLKAACSGYPSAGGVDALLKLNASKSTRNPAIVTHSLQRDLIGVNRENIERLVVRPSTLAARGVVIRPFLVTARKLQEISDDLPEERRRKLQRLEYVRQTEGYSFAKENGNLTKDLYIKDIQTLKSIRQQTKEKTIMAALFQSITTVHPIFPTLGSTEFMEFLLTNPYNEPVTIDIDISDKELKIVSDVREWQYFKIVYNLLTPLDASMFSSKAAKPGDQPITEIYLNPRESVYVPLKYQTYQSIDYPDYREGFQKPSVRILLRSKTIKTTFRRADNGDMISGLILQVEPQPHVVHQTFRFYHPENQFLSKYIRIQPQELWAATQKGIEYAYCTDPTVICELRSSATAGVPRDVFVKVAAGTSPRVKRFIIMLYADAYLAKPIQIWQIFVHALQKIDVSTAQGDHATFPIVIKGDQASRLVQCFSSEPQEMILHPNAPFMVNPGATVDVQVHLKPLFSGERMMQITAVDMELKEMTKSWLVYASVKPAVITKAFQVIVPVGAPGRTLNKKVSYSNSYNMAKKFRLTSNRDDLVTIKEPAFLQLEAEASGVIGLQFNTNVSPQVTEILLFISDEDGKNEDTYGIKAVFAVQ